MLREYINPRVDLAFKKIFGTPDNKDLLIAFINAVVGERDQVSDLEILNPYNERSFAEDKLSVLDIKAKDLRGQYFNIEVQITDEADYDKRALYYWAKLYCEQLTKGMDYKQLRRTVGIHVLNFTSIPKAPDYHNEFAIQEVRTGLGHFDDFTMHTIELSKFDNDTTSDLPEFLKKVRTSLDRWVAFLTRANYFDKNALPAEMEDLKIHKAIEVVEEINLSKTERDAYEGRIKFLRAEDSAFRKVHDKGRKEGLIEGMEKGIKKGIEKGREEEKRLIAERLLKEGVDPSTVVAVTGLSVDNL